MRIATWNVNSLKARLPRVEEWIQYAQPDVLCLQETKLPDTGFPAMTFQAMGYESAHHGEGRWNGVAILSRVGLEDVLAGFGDDEPADPQARLLWATCGGVRVASVYVPNGRDLADDHYQYKLKWLARLRAQLDRDLNPAEPVIIGGDYNIAPADADVYDPAKYIGATHVSEPERAALGALEAWGLADTFRLLQPEPNLFTWWDYRAGNFHKGLGMRIDLLMATEPLAKRASFAMIDRNARKGQQPSDHAPLFIDFEDLDG